MKPIVYDLYSGLHGWLEAFLLEGYRCIAFDIVDMCAEIGHPRPEGIELRIRDVRSIHGSELKDAAVIVGSSPCQEFSYRAMPWKKAKALPPPYLGIELFNAQFRIQREAIEAAGHYIPMVVENVRGAQKWVGRAQWHCGSFFLWGDVPALMPIFRKLKAPGMNWSDQTKRGQDFTRIAGKHATTGEEWAAHLDGEEARKNEGGSWFNIGGPNQKVVNQNPVHELAALKVGNASARTFSERRSLAKAHPELDPHNFWHNSREDSGVKQSGISGVRENGKGDKWFQDGASRHGSRSRSRKMASAMIAKIPFPLAQHIARTFKPVDA